MLIIAMIALVGTEGESAVPDKIPIIFSPRYDMGVLGIERLHPFDSRKPGKVYAWLVERTGIDRRKFYAPPMASDEDLLLVHTPEYLDSLKRSSTVAAVAELGVAALIPNIFLQRGLLVPMRYATGGTVLGCDLALQYGWAINLSGGYHHAKSLSGGGFCFFADIPIGVKRLWMNRPELEVMIVDLDAHQGNGYASIFGDDYRIHIFDAYNAFAYPYDDEARRYIEFDYPLQPGTGDREYLALLERELGKAVEEVEPDIIIYNAGTDVFEGDPLGGLNITMEGIIKRDELVFRNSIERKIPILMLLSGGYTTKSAEIIARSIENLLRNVIPGGNSYIARKR
jgi:histone deacetylase 11